MDGDSWTTARIGPLRIENTAFEVILDGETNLKRRDALEHTASYAQRIDALRAALRWGYGRASAVTALLACAGCGVMLFNWIAINFIIAGLHSYA